MRWRVGAVDLPGSKNVENYEEISVLLHVLPSFANNFDKMEVSFEEEQILIEEESSPSRPRGGHG